ncbi:hypothetical protein PENSPDRAFT_324443 [Peniophora sp. CONT]|nr:hypothetical protein PENSPDRAFT_324443 [Peniophora sp. CONT]
MKNPHDVSSLQTTNAPPTGFCAAVIAMRSSYTSDWTRTLLTVQVSTFSTYVMMRKDGTIDACTTHRLRNTQTAWTRRAGMAAWTPVFTLIARLCGEHLASSTAVCLSLSEVMPEYGRIRVARQDKVETHRFTRISGIPGTVRCGPFVPAIIRDTISLASISPLSTFVTHLMREARRGSARRVCWCLTNAHGGASRH